MKLLSAAFAFTFGGFFLGVGFWSSRKLTDRIDGLLASKDPELVKLAAKLKEAKEAQEKVAAAATVVDPNKGPAGV